MERVNITGKWIGYYEQQNVRTSFVALIQQLTGKLYFTGTIQDDMVTRKCDALINGTIDSANINFTKKYTTFHNELIDYAGYYQTDGVIIGKWTIRNTNDTGYFEMWKTGQFVKNEEEKHEEFKEIITVVKKDKTLNDVFPITKN